MSRAPHDLGAQFQAKWDSNCPGCDQAIYEGDLMGYVDNVAQCDGCYNDADLVNRAELQDLIKAQEEAERAADPEEFDWREAAVKKWIDSVKAKAAENPGKEWVPSPGATPGWVRVPPETNEPPLEEQEPPVTTETIEPGIQALMAAGLLQGQEPGGDGVCNATIMDGSGKITEVPIPVPVDPPAAKARAPRKSRAKVKPEPEAVPSASSAEDGPAAALAQVRDAATVARVAQLEANAADWDPQAIVNEVYGPGPTLPAAVAAPEDAPVADLQASLQAAVNAGVMTCDQAEALGWVDPVLKMIREAVPTSPPLPGNTPRTLEPLQEFMANPGTGRADIFLDALSAATSQPEEDAILGALDNLAPYGGPVDVEEAKKSILDTIEDAITNHPRSLQKSIGPSEIGTECDHCLGAKLAEWDQIREGGAWLPTVGTAVHTWLEWQVFMPRMLDAFDRPQYLMERKVAVGEINGREITGSTDLVDLVRGMTWDWKIVGATTLKSAKAAPSRRYVVQQMLYARGWRRLGVHITHVGIAYLPRNDVSLRKAVLWTAPYDEALAVEALARADAMAKNLEAMESISVETRDAYVTSLPRWRSWREPVNGVEKLVYGNAAEGTIECLDCARYPDYPADPAQALKQLDGLL